MKKNIPVGAWLKRLLAHPVTKKVIVWLISIVGEKLAEVLTKKLVKQESAGIVLKEEPMNKFSNTSEKRLSTCHKDLQILMHRAIETSPVDFGIAEGHRSVERQQELFNSHPPRTQIDGVKKKSKHNYDPSQAVDIFGWVNGRTCYDIRVMSFLGGWIMSLAAQLHKEGIIENKIRWGGNWDSDGEIITDQTLVDTPHFEVVF